MPIITITDEQGQEVLTSDLTGAGLGKYFRAAASLRSAVAIGQAIAKPLTERTGARTLGLTLDTSVPVGAAGELSISGGAKVGIGLHDAGATLLGDSDLQASVVVPPGMSYTSVTLEALLDAQVAGAAGAISFGFKAGTALRYAYFHPFNAVGAVPTVGEAIKIMLGAAIFPADADDLARLPVGAVASVAGEGEITFQGKASLSSSTNLLSTPGLPLVGTVALTQGATVSVDAAWTASGEFELRLARRDASHVHMSFFRRRGRSLTVSATATAGVSATVKGKELLSALMTAISPNPEADLLSLVNGGLEDEPIEAIQKAVAASIDRTLTLAAQLRISAVGDDEALYSYDIDVTRITDAHKPVLREALHGKLAAIDTLAADGNGPVRALETALRQLRERKTSWRINVLGILNVASFLDLVREGSVTFDPVSGSLTAADKVSATRIRVVGRPLESDTGKLRKVLMESLMVTAAYKAGRALGSAVTLSSEHVYVEQRGKTSRQDLEDQYRVLIALGLCDRAEREARLGSIADFGRSTFTIQNRFDSAACDALFLTADGKARPVADYESLGRRAFLALLPADDPMRAFRRPHLVSDDLWARIRDLGGAIADNLPDQVRHDGHKLGLVRGDVLTIVWWASAMSKAATALVTTRAFVGQRDAATLFNNPDFIKVRGTLSKALGGVVATTEAVFDDPWDILAMDAAAARKGALEAVILTTPFAARYSDDHSAPALAVAPPVARAVRAPVAAAAGKAARDWTEDERAVFARHVVNLRAGLLSTDGTFQSSAEQVQRIFAELIPAYARQQAALGQPARVLFFAHGGLNDEREGLLPVLFRRRFWELNGVYPVYFVWETGLREALIDIVRSAVPGRADRSALGDAAIEQGARAGGKVVWGRMKTSADRAAAVNGGAALVATAAGELWKRQGGEIEFHALGHSAGSIFHAFFLPLLVAQRPAGVPPVDVRTLHLLAPAITTDLFKARLKKLIGSGLSITRLTTYTMDDEHEQHDQSLHPYGKSLLYLVSQAFEDKEATPILGLQKSLKTDLQLIRFFGLAGTEKVADITFSTSGEGTPLDARTQSITHGGFDNDIATMTSVIRRVLDVADGTAVVDYFEDPVAGFDRAAVGAPPQ